MEALGPIAAALAPGSSTSPGSASSLLDSAFGGLDMTGAEGLPGLGQTAAAAGGSVAPAFGEVLSQFLGKVDNTQHSADAMVESLALGEPVDVHQVMLALTQATDALQLTLQVRGKILDAYQEVMKTQI